MNRLAIRTWAAEVTGRYDLVDGSFADNGMDKYITSAQRFLDRQFNFPRGFSSHFEKLDAGGWYTQFENNRSIKTVYVNTSESRSELNKKDRHWLMGQYNEPIAETGQGSPLYWAPAEIRTQGSIDKDDLGEFFRFIVDDDEDYNAVIILPPPDEEIVVEVYGQFYTPDFTKETGTTWWSVHHPELLVWATAYTLEISYRNREGAKDWLESITLHSRQIDFDTVETDIAGVDQIEG